MSGRAATHEQEARDLARGFWGQAKAQDTGDGGQYEREGESYKRDGGRHERGQPHAPVKKRVIAPCTALGSDLDELIEEGYQEWLQQQEEEEEKQGKEITQQQSSKKTPEVMKSKECISALPNMVLVHVLSNLEDPADVRSVLRTSRGMLAMKDDHFLMASWLFKQRPKDGIARAALGPKGADVMVQLLHLGVSATDEVVWPFRCKGFNEFQLVSPLRIAASSHASVVQHLLQQDGVRADAEDMVQALHDSVTFKKTACLEAFLGSSAPVHANSSLPNGQSPLHVAAANASIPLVKRLLSHGALCTACTAHGTAPLHSCCSDSSRLNRQWALDVGAFDGDESWDDSSSEAASFSDEECSYSGSSDSESSLCDDGGFKRTLQLLLKTPSGKAAIDWQDEDGCTALLLAARNGLAECCALLLEAGSKALYTANNEGTTPWDACSYDGSPSVDDTLDRYGRRP